MTLFSDWTPQIEQTGWVLIHSLWQFTLIAWFVWLAKRMCRKSSASARYRLYLVALGAVMVVPAVTAWQIFSRTAPSVSRTSSGIIPSSFDEYPAQQVAYEVQASQSRDSSPDLTRVASPTGNSETPSVTASESATSTAVWPSLIRRLEPWLPLMVGTWWLGMLTFACRPLWGWYTVQRLRKVGISSVPVSLEALLAETARKSGLRRAVGLLYSSLVRAPVVVGYFKPLILLPLCAAGELTVSQLEAIIAHELAHVRRHDYLVNLLQTLIETIFFYHPAVWWLSHQTRIEREHCCDDMAVATLGNRIEYGRALLAVEELRGANLGLALGVGGGSLVARVRRLLSTETTQPQSSLPGLIVIITFLAIGVTWGMGLSGSKQANAQEAVKKEAPAASETATKSTKDDPPTPDSGSGTGKLPLVRPTEVPAELQKKFYEWDKEYRHKSEEKFLELEAVATGLANETADKALRASIYAQVAHIAGQSTITKHVERVRKFANRALETSRDPLQRAYMHSMLGSTFEIDQTLKEFTERRRLAADRLLTGWVELLKYDIPQKAPELPAVGSIGDRFSNDPAEIEKVRKINEAQVAARKQAEYVRDVVAHRDILANQLRWLFRPDFKVSQRGHEGPAVLYELAMKKVSNDEAVAALLTWVTAVNPLHPEQKQEALTAPARILDRLVSIDFTDETLHEGLELMLQHAGGGLELDSEGLKTVGVTKNAHVSAKANEVTVRNALKLLLSSFPDVSFTETRNVVYVSSKDRVKKRDDAAQAAKDAELKRFAGDWRLYAAGAADQIDPKSQSPQTDIRFRVTGSEVLRTRNWQPYGWGMLGLYLDFSPTAFVIQFKDAGGDAGYLRGFYEFRDDGSLWLKAQGPYQQRGVFVEAKGDSTWTMLLKRDTEDSRTEARTAASLEFRFAANPADSNVEPHVPADYLQRHYRDGSEANSAPTKDQGFVWFPIADAVPSNVDLPLEGTVGKLRRALLSDLPEHILVADDKWKIERCEVVSGEGSRKDHYSLRLRLNEAGGEKLRKLTESHLNQKLAIVVNGKIITAPLVLNAVGTDVMITGRFAKDEAEGLAKALQPQE